MIAEKLYVAWRRALPDPTAVLAWGNIDTDSRRAFEAAAGVVPELVLDVVKKSLATCDCRGVGCIHDQVRALVEREVADRVVATGGMERKLLSTHNCKLADENAELTAKLENAEAAWQESVGAVNTRIAELEAIVHSLAGVTREKITSGTELDWKAVGAAAELITKQVQDIGYCPPDSVDIHQMRAGYVCDAIQAICVALRLRPAAAARVVELEAELARHRAGTGAFREACDVG